MSKQLHCFSKLLRTPIAVGLLGATLAHGQSFVGSFQPTVFYDTNVFDGVQLASDVGDVQIAPGQVPGQLSLSFTYASRTLILPLTASGSVARLSTPNVSIGAATILDLILISDGNNSALGFLERFAAGTPSVRTSFAMAQWQTSTAVPTASPAGAWATSLSYYHPNVRNAVFPVFAPGSGLTSDFVVSQSPLEMVTPRGPSFVFPLSQAGTLLQLSTSPYALPSANFHLLNFMYDGFGTGSIITVVAETFDPGDVALGLTLVRAVPEAPTGLLILAGMAALASTFSSRRRKVGTMGAV